MQVQRAVESGIRERLPRSVKRSAFIPLASFLLIIACVSCQEKTATPSNAPQTATNAPAADYTCDWAMASIERTRQMNPAVADAQFSDYAGSDPGIPVLPIQWVKKTQHVPHANWTCYLSWENREQAFTVLWRDLEKGHRMDFGPMPANKSFPDVFAQGKDTPEGRERTKRLFKTPPTLHSLLQLAFSHDAKSFQCTPESRDEGIRFAMALTAANSSLALAEHVQAYKATPSGDQHIITGKNRGKTWRAIVDAEQDGIVWRLEAASPLKEFIDSVVHFSQQSPSAPKLISDTPVQPQCAKLMAFAIKPSEKEARRMLEGPAVADNKALKQALQEYLQANKQ